VVDSAAISSAAGLTEAAEYLHEVLLLLQKKHTQGKTSKTEAMPVLIAANKQDVFSSLPVGLVRAKLEDEITKVRLTRSKGLMDSGVGMEDDVGGVDEEQNWLGEFGSVKFKFAQMEEHGIEVKVAGGNVKGDGSDAGRVGEWWAWVGDNL
jgi:signal recognition particle receptor subunit beta